MLGSSAVAAVAVSGMAQCRRRVEQPSDEVAAHGVARPVLAYALFTRSRELHRGKHVLYARLLTLFHRRSNLSRSHAWASSLRDTLARCREERQWRHCQCRVRKVGGTRSWAAPLTGATGDDGKPPLARPRRAAMEHTSS